MKPIRNKEYDVQKNEYVQLGSLTTRSILFGPSGSGKSILLQNTILDVYKGLSNRIYIYILSPSLDLDFQTR